MVYLRRFALPAPGSETHFLADNRESKRTCYGSRYPFGVFLSRAVPTLEFEPGLVGHDLKAALDVFSPYRDEKGRVIHYQHHDTWHDDNGSSHIKALLLSPFITVPIVAGRMTLGPWQNLTLVECDTRDRVRDIVFQVMGE